MGLDRDGGVADVLEVEVHWVHRVKVLYMTGWALHQAVLSVLQLISFEVFLTARVVLVALVHSFVACNVQSGAGN